MAGRPSSYTDEIATEICTRLSNGESLVSICRDDRMPSRETVRQWLISTTNQAASEFPVRYARAREAQADSFVDEITDIADNSTSDDWTVARLRVQARQWAAGKLAPKKYGDRLDQYIKQEATVRTVSDKPEDTKQAVADWLKQHSNGHAQPNGNGHTNGKGNGHG